MKTRILSIAFVLLCVVANAQVKIGVLGGVNFSNINGKDFNGDAIENTMLQGFHAGVNVLVPIAPEFYFQPGLLFSTKGSKNEGTLGTATTSLSYLELPLNFVYRGALGSGFVLVGVGPYLGYGISGKMKLEGGNVSAENNVEFQNTIEDGDSPLVPYYKAFDAGGNIFLGYEMAGGLFAQLNAQLGMIDINPENKVLTGDKSSLKNTGFGLSLGYRF